MDDDNRLAPFALRPARRVDTSDAPNQFRRVARERMMPVVNLIGNVPSARWSE